MFEARLEKAIVFKKIIAAIKLLITDISFDITHVGISVQQMDSAHVALVEFVLHTDAFTDYRVDTNIVIAVSTIALDKALKMVPDNSYLHMSHKPGSKDELVLDFYCGYEARVKITMIDLEFERLGIPDTKYHLQVNGEKIAFHTLFANLNQSGDNAIFSIVDGSLIISAIGDGGEFTAKFRTDDEDDTFQITLHKPSPPLGFSLRYLNMMTNTYLSRRAVFDIAENAPARITYDITSPHYEEEVIGKVRFYLAPRIENE